MTSINGKKDATGARLDPLHAIARTAAVVVVSPAR
jgi:hypothetical protein